MDYTIAGRLGGAVLRGVGLPPDAVAYLCGPAAFMDELTGTLAALGIRRVHREVFAAAAAIMHGVRAAESGPPQPPPGPPGTGPAITFARSGLTVGWDAGYGSVLALAEACRVPVRWSCRTGVCHTCETGLLSGEVESEPAPLEAPAGGATLICCARPRSDLVLDL